MTRFRSAIGLTMTVALFAAFAVNMQCSEDTPSEKVQQAAATNQKVPSVITIRGIEEFKRVIDQGGDRLLVFDLYADWCMPCKILSPMLEEIASEHKDKATFYKVNVDQMPAVAQAFQVQGIPYVVFIKNKQAVDAITGVRAKEDYVRAIVKFAGNGGAEKD